MLAFPDLAEIPTADEALRADVRDFLAEHQPPAPSDKRARSWTGFDAEFSRALGRRGWLGLTLPREYGGAEMGAFARFVIVEELLAAGAPVAGHWIADRQSGPLILRFGNQAQRDFHLPRICQGESFFCIGMSEPDTGSDLASVRTRAEPDGDGLLLNGAKIWTSGAQYSHYMIALVRTSGTTADRQKGLSQVIVDLSLPGVTINPIQDLTGDFHFNEVVFENVRLGPDALVGDEGAGWHQCTAELAFERSGPERLLSSVVLLDSCLAWLRSTGDMRHAATIGRMMARLATLRAMSISVTARLAAGDSPVVEAALVKDLGTEFEQWIPAALTDIVAADPDAAPPPELLRALAFTTAIAPSFSLRGGTREILRGMIARGMGLR